MEAILIVSIFILCFSNETFEVLASSTDNKPEGFNKQIKERNEISFLSFIFVN